MQHVTIDMAGLPDALAIDLKNQMEAMVKEAIASIPLSFERRVELALAELPYEDVKNIKVPMLASSLKSQLQQHFDKSGFIKNISNQAKSCINWGDEGSDDIEFEHQLDIALNWFFI